MPFLRVSYEGEELPACRTLRQALCRAVPVEFAKQVFHKAGGKEYSYAHLYLCGYALLLELFCAEI
jgi:hypothetical protein